MSRVISYSIICLDCKPELDLEIFIYIFMISDAVFISLVMMKCFPLSHIESSLFTLHHYRICVHG